MACERVSNEELSVMHRRDVFSLAGVLAAGAGLAAANRNFAATANGDAGVQAEASAMDDFLAALRRSSALVDTLASGGTEQDRAEGLRFLTRMIALGFDRAVEYADPANPALYRLQSPVRKYTGDAPDQLYHTASVGAGFAYRLRGRLRDEHISTLLLEATVYGGNIEFNAAGSRRLVGHLDERQLRVDRDGNFEIRIAAERAGAANFLPLEPDARKLTVRRYFASPQINDPLPLTLERIDGPPSPAPVQRQAVEQGLRRAGAFVEETLQFWSKWTAATQARGINTMSPMPDAGDILTPAGVRYVDGAWALGPDEALLVRFVPPDVPYWSFVPLNMWGESFDWTRARACINSLQAVRDAAGEVTLVLAERDPGHPNWVRVLGQRSGTMSLRFARMVAGSALPVVMVSSVRK